MSLKEIFGDRKAQVFVIEPNASLRQGVSNALKQLGFSNVLRFGSIQEVTGILNTENKPDWVLASLMPTESLNLFNLLEYCIKNERLNSCRLSLFVDETESFCVRDAMQMGLLSFHPKEVNVDSIRLELGRLIELMASCGWDPCLTSFHYIADLCITSADFEEINFLVKNLLALYPNDPQVNYRQAQCQFIQGNVSKAVFLLRQVRSTAPKMAKSVDELCVKYLGQRLDENNSDNITFAQTYDLRSVSIVDPDETIQNSLKTVFERLGTQQIDCFSDGKTFMESLSAAAAPSVVVMEWKIPQISGPALLQRIRLEKKLDIPVILHSSIVGEKDRLLLREMGVTDIISKPLYANILIEEIKTIIEHEKSGEDADVLERHIRGKLRTRDLAGAQAFFEQMRKSNKIPDARKDQLQAEIMLFQGDLAQAKKLAVASLNAGGENLLLLDLLGRVLLKQRDFQMGMKFMDKANRLSPTNIERLCALAESSAEMGDKQAAESRLDQVRKIDADSQLAVETSTVIAIDSGDMEIVKNLMDKVTSKENVVAVLNNKAVYLVSMDRVSEGMSLYSKALRALPPRAQELKEMITYNMGLAYAKLGDLKKAARVLGPIAENRDSRLYAKCRSLYARIKKAIEANTELVLLKGAEQKNSLEEAFAPLEITSINRDLPTVDHIIHPGQLCCYLIFQSRHAVHPDVVSLLEKRSKMLGGA